MKTTTLTISNPISDSLLRCALILIPFVLICVATLPGAHAVSPPPPGGYPNFTTAAGDNALQALTLGVGNTAIGTFSLSSVTTGNFNTAVGAGALDLNTADQNTATGAAALLFNTTGTDNTANGAAALEFNDTGSFNTANGTFALFSNTTGSDNTATGAGALVSNIEGNFNTADGNAALSSNTTGDENTATGTGALRSNTDGDHNTAIGDFALQSNTDGDNNTAIGSGALSNATGMQNTALGVGAGSGVTTANSVICIGSGVAGENVSESCYIGNIFNATSSSGSAVFVNATGKLGTITSSRRFKEKIKPMDQVSKALFALKPVSFRYKKEIDPAGTSQLGLVAEDVEKVNPDLVVRDKEGKAYSVRYDQVNAMLLNEFLKEHRKVENLKNDFQTTVAQQQKEIAALTATVKEQAAQIQKVSAQLEANKPAPQVVNNP
jgi:Chaperone of endosialidase